MLNMTYIEDPNNIEHKVYDASLKVNVSEFPNGMDGNVQLPTGMSFSQYTDDEILTNMGQVNILDDSYREHLCVWGKEGIASCYLLLPQNVFSVPTII